MGLGKGAVLAAGVVLAAGSAYAQADGWAGLYGGVTLGYGESHNTLSHNDLGGTPQDIDAAGGLGGIVVGYNWVNGNMVYGVEGDLSFAGIDGSAASGGGSSHAVELDAMLTLRGRAGVRVGQQGLVYGTAGLAGQRSTVSHSGAHPDWTETYLGWTAGVGYERSLPGGARVGVEVLYADFGSQSEVHTLGGTGGPHSLANDPSGTIFRLRAVFPF
tara:strand:- start:42 stop:689 length:648 start_codon:yes stop_codon:yes gene_type:complete